jgi:hypothetical protein
MKLLVLEINHFQSVFYERQIDRQFVDILAYRERSVDIPSVLHLLCEGFEILRHDEDRNLGQPSVLFKEFILFHP